MATERMEPVIVVGGGHAGAEAAAAAARLGAPVLLVALKKAHVGRLSCNPAVGGLAKGQLVREIDALGGLMARVADAATIQFRRLNTSKGLAVQSSRAQVDVDRYPQALQAALFADPRITFVEGEVGALLVERGRVRGVRLLDGAELRGRAVILTTGTFLGGIMHCGAVQEAGGRVGDPSTGALSRSLVAQGLRLGRLKTGTPPRLHADSIDWERLSRQGEVDPTGHFSFAPPAARLPWRDCFIAHTNEQTHAIIRGALHDSPLYTGAIIGRGPRYCPSIEDKVVRFADKTQHQLFLEPEGLDTPRIYVNGLSTSLPVVAQEAAVRSVEGLERARFLQAGYAVEYDFADPRDLDAGLQHKGIAGLYFAGQVNGTSGYEEAAAQGLVAGASAALGAPLRLGRDQAYIGVMIDDLTSRGIGGEPYRMFPSRAEHRLLLREDNADRRLMPLARAAGLLGDAAWERFSAKSAAIAAGAQHAAAVALLPNAATNARLAALGFGPVRDRLPLLDWLRRPEASWAGLRALSPEAPELSAEEAEQVETDARYAGYLRREEERAASARRLEGVAFPTDFNFRLPGVSVEVGERLAAARPATLGAASRLPGVTPAAVDLLAIHLLRAQP